VLTILAASAASAQPAPWPERPIRLVVPFTPGSSSDIVARIVAQKLGERLRQQVVVDNRVGASGNLGTEAVARAEPDGYTLGLANTSTHAVTASLSSKLGYDPVKDFAPVAMIGASPFVLAANPNLPAKTIPELLVLAKAKPRGLSYASAGPPRSRTVSRCSKTRRDRLIHALSWHGAIHPRSDRGARRYAVRHHLAWLEHPLWKNRALAVTGEQRSPTLPDV
jgi:tripartite-type tricarboxylate transporter receptor subunit TctC